MRWTLGAVIGAALQGLAACAPHEPRAATVLALAGDPARGRTLYGQTCAQCHKGQQGWGLTLRIYGRDGVVSTLIRGVPHTRMPSFSSWTDQQLTDVLSYVETLRS